MELRKLQKTGGTTYTVSLPRPWVDSNRLHAKSILAVEEQRDGTLRITPGTSTKPERSEATIRAEDNVYRRVIEKYLLGYDVLHINSETTFSAKQKAAVKKAVERLIGYEVLEESAKMILVHSLLDSEEAPVMKTLKRMHTIVHVMHHDLVSALEEKNTSLLDDVSKRDADVNRLYFLVVRQIRTVIQSAQLQDKEGIRAVDCVDARLAATLIEELGDLLQVLAQQAKKLPKKEWGPLVSLIKISVEPHANAAKAFLTKDEALAVHAQETLACLKWDPSKFTKTGALAFFNNAHRVAAVSKDLSDIVVSE